MGHRNWVMRSAVLLLVLILLPVSLCRTPHFDATKRIGVLAIGDTSYGESPVLGWLSLDFAVQWQELPTDVGDIMSDKDAMKITRIYTPRTLDRLTQTYDVLLLLEPRMWFTGTQLHMFKESVDLGVSSLLTMWPDDEGYSSLVDSELAQVYPQAFAPVFEAAQDVPYKVVLNSKAPPVLTPFLKVGIERFAGHKTRALHPKQGSTTWAWAVKGGLGTSREPYIISWKYGENDAETWTIGVDVDEQWFGRDGGNEYGGDILLNMLYYSVGKPLPENIELVHNLRNAFYRYSLEKKLVFSMIDFVDKFGANTAKLEREIEKADEGKKLAEQSFMEGDYQSSYSQIKAMVDELRTLNQEAVRIKDKALFWVFLTEWTVVSGVLLAAGVLLFSLMIRKRLYKEVLVTRTAY